MKELDAHYNSKEVEEGKYEVWEKAGLFHAGDETKVPFSLIIPPPNVTGKLHIGHAKNMTTIDVISRYKLLKGFDVLAVPGMDHAGIATQAKVEEKMRKEGLSRYDLGREEFMKRAWAWKDEYAANIHSQWDKMGIMLDYQRERFTLDSMTAEAVKTVFVKMFHEGLIYQGEKIINWDVEFQTALSNIEVEHKDIPGKFYYFKYKVVETGEILIVATTRPETMFADVAVTYSPKDKRYTHLKGCHVINPANGDSLPLIADDYVDITFGTGLMKVTPAHDPNDFNIAKRHNLEHPSCINKDGTMGELAKEYAKLDRFECRELMVNKMTEENLVYHIDNVMHSVGHSERSHTIVEPTLSKQWFIKMGPLAGELLEMQKSSKGTKFLPAHFEKILNHWMTNCEDWCISRQLWWGHRIPVFYHKVTGEIYCEMEDPKNIDDYIQDSDVLDTWFSSALSPFANLGWPEMTADFKRYYPTDVLITAYDIIFFWVARMLFQGIHFTKQIPFKHVLLHGLIRDSQGRKMSKSLGNGIDPLDVIDEYGADTLRYYLSTGCAPGLDFSFQTEKIKAAHNFIDKIWNSARFIISNLGDDFIKRPLKDLELSEFSNKIIHELIKARHSYEKNLDNYQEANATKILSDFVYDSFCSSYLEYSKLALNSDDAKNKESTKQVLFLALENILLMLHPFAPFVTEEIYLSLPEHRNSIMEERFEPIDYKCSKVKIFRAERIELMIKALRAFKVDNKLAPNAKLLLTLGGSKKEIELAKPYLERFGFASIENTIKFEDRDKSSLVFKDLSLSIKAKDEGELKARLEKRIEFLKAEIKRSEGILSNPNFLKKAPANKVAEEKEKLENYRHELSNY